MIENLRLTLADIAGEEYVDKVCRASAAFGLKSYRELRAAADRPVDFFPEALDRKSVV